MACAQNNVCCGLNKTSGTSRVLEYHVAFVYFLFAEFFFLFNRPAKLQDMYIVRMNLDVLQ